MNKLRTTASLLQNCLLAAVIFLKRSIGALILLMLVIGPSVAIIIQSGIMYYLWALGVFACLVLLVCLAFWLLE